jgi:hypothetical protein
VVELRVRGADQLRDLARDLKSEADGKERRKDMLRGIRKIANPLAKETAPKIAREGLPKGGGLNEYVASSKFGVRTRTTGQSVGVRIVGAKGEHDINAMDRGQVRHKVWGVWRSSTPIQQITPGWWTKGMSDPLVLWPLRRELLKVLDQTARRIARG